MLQNSPKNQSPHSFLIFGRGSINGDFDFFGEFHGFTPKHLCILYQTLGDFWGKLNFVQILPIWTFWKTLT